MYLAVCINHNQNFAHDLDLSLLPTLMLYLETTWYHYANFRGWGLIIRELHCYCCTWHLTNQTFALAFCYHIKHVVFRFSHEETFCEQNFNKMWSIGMQERIACSLALNKSTQMCSVRACVRACVRMSAFEPVCTYVRACLDACFSESWHKDNSNSPCSCCPWCEFRMVAAARKFVWCRSSILQIYRSQLSSWAARVTLRYELTQYNTIQYNTIQYNTTP